MNMLLTSGADFEHAGNTGQTALMYAAMENRPAAVKFLLDRGADFTKTDKQDRTALDIARTNEYEEIVDILEAAGAGQGAGGELGGVPGPHSEGIPMEEEDAGSGGPRPLDRG
jgi:ankyrin repeat protein